MLKYEWHSLHYFNIVSFICKTLFYLLLVVRTNVVFEVAPLGGVTGDAVKRSSHDDDVTGVSDGVKAVNDVAETFGESDDAIGSLRDSSSMPVTSRIYISNKSDFRDQNI